MLELNKNDNTFVRYTLGRFGYGDLVSQRRSNATSFYHFDAIGTTRALTDASQAVTDTYIQRAFGATRTTTGSTANYHRYIGKLGYYREATLPAHYLRRRYYSPELGRFLSRDPIRTAGVSEYGYVGNRAAARTDPSGLQVPPPPPPGGGSPEPPGAFPPAPPPLIINPPPIVIGPLEPPNRPPGPPPWQPPGWDPWPGIGDPGLPAKYGAWWGNQVPCGVVVTKWMRCFRKLYHESWCKTCALEVTRTACWSLDVYQALWCVEQQSLRYAECLSTGGWWYPPAPILP